MASADDFRLVDLEREEVVAEVEEEAKRKKRERAKVALGMLSSRFQRVEVDPTNHRVPDSSLNVTSHGSVAVLPLRTSTEEGAADTKAKEQARFFPAMDAGKLSLRPDLEKLACQRESSQRFGGYSQAGDALDAQRGARLGGYSLLKDSAGLQAPHEHLDAYGYGLDTCFIV